jgi:hypothetical protein
MAIRLRTIPTTAIKVNPAQIIAVYPEGPGRTVIVIPYIGKVVVEVPEGDVLSALDLRI